MNYDDDSDYEDVVPDPKIGIYRKEIQKLINKNHSLKMDIKELCLNNSKQVTKMCTQQMNYIIDLCDLSEEVSVLCAKINQYHS